MIPFIIVCFMSDELVSKQSVVRTRRVQLLKKYLWSFKP